MEINFINWCLASSPIIIFLTLILVMKWSGSRSGALTWLITVIIAWKYFGADVYLIGYSYVKAFFISVDILLIIVTALFLHRINEKAGTIQRLGFSISKVTNNRAFLAILLGWLFPSFLQGVGGFGVPVAVSAPLLVSAGFSPLQSVIMASVGHAWGVSFGSMASSFQSLIAATNLPSDLLGAPCAILLGIISFFCGLLVTFIADGVTGVKQNIVYTLFFSCILGVIQYVLVINGLWIIAVTLSSLIALSIGLIIINLSQVKKKRNTNQIHKIKKRLDDRTPSIIVSILPYAILVISTLVINVIRPFNNLLSQAQVFVQFPEITSLLGDITPAGPGRIIHIFTHPGTIILFTAIISFLIFNKMNLLKRQDLLNIFIKTINGSIQTSLVLFLMVGIAVIMSHTRMTEILAQGFSYFFNRDLYSFISPMIGALGAFITGNNTSSNVIFAGLQMRTADLLGLSIPFILAAQTAGGAIGSVLSPAKVFLGCSTVDLCGKEGRVIGKLIGYGLILVFICGIITALFT